jgi:hypothetical protein
MWGSDFALLNVAILTDQGGNSSQLRILSHPFTQTLSHMPHTIGIEARAAHEWTESLIFDGDEKPGAYHLQAKEGVLTSESKLAGDIASQPIEVSRHDAGGFGFALPWVETHCYRRRVATLSRPPSQLGGGQRGQTGGADFTFRRKSQTLASGQRFRLCPRHGLNPGVPATKNPAWPPA